MKLHFHNKLFISISLIITAISILYIVIFSSYVYKNLLNESKSNLYQITTRTSSDLETIFKDMDKLALYISTNPDVIKAFLKAKKVDYDNHDLSDQISTIITSINIPNTSSRYRINLFNQKGNFISTGIPYNSKMVTKILTSPNYRIWYDNLPIVHNKANLTPFMQDKWSNSNTKYLSLYREIFDSSMISQVLGIIQLQCPYDIIDTSLSFPSGDKQAYLFDQKGHLIYSSNPDRGSYSVLYQAYLKQANTTYSGGTYEDSIFSGTYLDNGWCLVLTQPQTQLTLVLQSFALFVIVLGFSSLLICLGITFVITKHSTKPLRDLTEYAKQVTLDNLSLDMDYGQYPDEVINLNHSFQKMFDRLKHSMDENVKMKAYEMRANMIALQSQIDPHFLYNILSVIKSMSRENKSQEIGTACNYLVEMLRYTTNYTEELVTLNAEIENANCYLSLMKFRYENQFTYSFDISPSIDQNAVLLPKLIIQPLLENCFQHGFKKVLPPWNIKIQCWQENQNYYLRITDNGIGIAEEDVSLLYQRLDEFLLNPSNSIASLKLGGMGLVNTIARLKLRYKEDIILDIVSLSKGGTQITIGGFILDEYINR